MKHQAALAMMMNAILLCGCQDKPAPVPTADLQPPAAVSTPAPALAITSVEPNPAVNSTTEVITIKGTGLSGARLFFQMESGEEQATIEPAEQSDNSLTVHWTNGIQRVGEGTFNIIAVKPDGDETSVPKGITILPQVP